MEQSNKIIPNLDNVDSKMFFINHCEYTTTDFFERLLEGSTVVDGCVLQYKDKSYDIERVHEVGVIMDRDVRMYKLTEYIEPVKKIGKHDIMDMFEAYQSQATYTGGNKSTHWMVAMPDIEKVVDEVMKRLATS